MTGVLDVPAMTWLNRIHPHPRLAGSHRSFSGWVEPLRVIYDHQLVMFFDAGYRLRIGEQDFDCPANSFIVIPPGILHTSSLQTGSHGTRCWVHLDWVFQKTKSGMPVHTYYPARGQKQFYHFAPAFMPNRILRGQIPAPTSAREIHRRLETRWNRGTDRERETCRGLLLELVLELFTPEPRRADPQPDARSLPSRARELLHKAATSPVNRTPAMDQILHDLGCSYEHACRTFRQAYGISPLAYMNSLRIERAKLLLTDTELPAGRIGREVGFDNPAYFSRMFRRHTGMSPGEYRKQDTGRQ